MASDDTSTHRRSIVAEALGHIAEQVLDQGLHRPVHYLDLSHWFDQLAEEILRREGSGGKDDSHAIQESNEGAGQG